MLMILRSQRKHLITAGKNNLKSNNLTIRKFTKGVFLFSFLLIQLTLSAQDSCRLRISLLTCSPGEELYSTFGHSAIRVVDSIHKDDIVFNYGTFDFDDPDFYTKFTRGKLMYYLSTEEYNSFREAYRRDGRSITEQVLNLNCNERKRMYSLLLNNLQDGNKFYKYDFLFDNCTSRLRDLLEKSSDSAVQFGRIVKEKSTFRKSIYQYLNSNDKQWSKLGIDMLLGAKLDAVMNNRQVMFLPDYLMNTFDRSTIGSKPVVASKTNVVTFGEIKQSKNFFSDPIFIFSVLLILVVVLTASKNSRTQRYLLAFDGFLFFLIGAMGILMLFMWFGTEHVMCKDNYNLLWAWPTHAFFAFLMNRKRKWVTGYFKTTAIIYSLLLLTWFFLPQHLNTALIPIVLLMIFRSGMRGYKRI
jgi:hypothetical protein